MMMTMMITLTMRVTVTTTMAPSAHHHSDIFSSVSFHDFLTYSTNVKNDATVDEVASLLHELHPQLRCSVRFRIECFLEAHCELICRLLGLRRGLLVERALKEAFNDPPETLVASFSRLLVSAVVACERSEQVHEDGADD